MKSKLPRPGNIGCCAGGHIRYNWNTNGLTRQRGYTRYATRFMFHPDKHNQELQIISKIITKNELKGEKNFYIESL